MTLENLIGKGLQREPASKAEILRFITKINTKLADARNEHISLDSRFDLAYEALLQIGLAALRANNLRPDSRGGHHILALQTLHQHWLTTRETPLVGRIQKTACGGLIRRFIRTHPGRTG